MYQHSRRDIRCIGTLLLCYCYRCFFSPAHHLPLILTGFNSHRENLIVRSTSASTLNWWPRHKDLAPYPFNQKFLILIKHIHFFVLWWKTRFFSSTGRYENSEGCAPFPVWRWSWNNGAVIFRQRAGTRSAVAESSKVNFLRLFSERSEMTLSLSLIELTFLPATFPRKRAFHVQNLTFRDKKVRTRILMLY